MKIKILISSIVMLLLFSGCSSRRVVTRFKSESNYAQQMHMQNNPNNFRFKPVIGTKQDDTKVMIDMGQFAKIWIKNYHNKNETYVSSHDIITMIKAPGFIAGEDLPRQRRRAVQKTYGARTFSYRSSDLMYQDSSNGNSGVDAKEIKDYMNSYEESKKFKKVPTAKKVAVKKYDTKIKKFLKEHRKINKTNDSYNENSIYSDPEERKGGSLK